MRGIHHGRFLPWAISGFLPQKENRERLRLPDRRGRSLFSFYIWFGIPCLCFIQNETLFLSFPSTGGKIEKTVTAEASYGTADLIGTAGDGPAIGQPDAAAHPGGICRARAPFGRGKNFAAIDRPGPHFLHDLLGAARRGKDHPSAHHRRTDPRQFHRFQRSDQRHQRDPRGHAARRRKPPVWGEDHPICR